MKSLSYLHVGRLVGTHGIKGEVRVLPDTDFQEIRFAPGATLLLEHDSIPEPIQLTVETSRPHKNVLLVRFEEWTDIQQVEPFKNGRLVVPMEEMVPIEEEDAFYYHEIIGCNVVTEEGHIVGQIREIRPYPANDVWVIRSHKDGSEILLPFIEEIVKQIDTENRLVTIAWMEGLE